MQKRPLAWMIAAVALSAAGCTSAPMLTADGQALCLSAVQSFSDPEAGARGDFSPNVPFAELRLTPMSVGYGAAGGRGNEITIVDGVLHLARPNGAGSYSERTTFQSDEGAYMVQMVSPAAWRDPVKLGAMATIDDLGAAIAAASAKAGCSGDARLAYRITARIEMAEWSLDTLPQRGDFTTTDQDAIIVGLYATVDQAKHFVTPGRNIHAHVVFPALGIAGHLKSVRLAAGAQLRLQGE